MGESHMAEVQSAVVPVSPVPAPVGRDEIEGWVLANRGEIRSVRVQTDAEKPPTYKEVLVDQPVIVYSPRGESQILWPPKRDDMGNIISRVDAVSGLYYHKQHGHAKGVRGLTKERLISEESGAVDFHNVLHNHDGLVRADNGAIIDAKSAHTQSLSAKSSQLAAAQAQIAQ